MYVSTQIHGFDFGNQCDGVDKYRLKFSCISSQLLVMRRVGCTKHISCSSHVLAAPTSRYILSL